MLKNECKQLGGVAKDECEMAVSVLLPQLFDTLEKELTEQMCVTIGLCNSTDRAVAIAAATARLRAALRSDAVKKVYREVNGVNTDDITGVKHPHPKAYNVGLMTPCNVALIYFIGCQSIWGWSV